MVDQIEHTRWQNDLANDFDHGPQSKLLACEIAGARRIRHRTGNLVFSWMAVIFGESPGRK